MAGFRRIRDILDMHVKYAGMVSFQVGYRIAPIAQVVSDIQAHANACIQLFHMFPNIGRIRIGLDVRPMQMDSIMEIILLHLLVYIRQKFIIRDSDNQFDSNPFRIFKRTVYFRLALHVNRANGITGHPRCLALPMESLDLFIRAVER